MGSFSFCLFLIYMLYFIQIGLYIHNRVLKGSILACLRHCKGDRKIWHVFLDFSKPENVFNRNGRGWFGLFYNCLNRENLIFQGFLTTFGFKCALCIPKKTTLVILALFFYSIVCKSVKKSPKIKI